MRYYYFLCLQLDDAALQLYKDGDYSSYLDLDSSISEQQEEFEGFQPMYVRFIYLLTLVVHSLLSSYFPNNSVH